MAKKALDAPRGNYFFCNPDDLIIVTDEKHVLYDPRCKLGPAEDLVLNIMYMGMVIDPVTVTKEGDKVLVVNGRRRVMACREANKRLKEQGKEQIAIPTIVRRGEAADLFGVLVTTNEQRLDDTPLARAQKANRLLNMGRSEEQVAAVFGVSAQSVRQWIKLLDLSVPVKKAVEAGQISASAAVQLIELPVAEQTATVKQLVAEGVVTGKRPTARKAARVAGKNGSKMKSRREVEKRLKEDKLPRDYRSALLWVLGTETLGI